MTGDPTTAPRELAARWVVWHVHGDEPHDDMNAKALTPAERERLLSWVRAEADGLDLDAGVRRLLGLLGWEYHAGRGSPSYDDALALLRAARGAS